MKQPKKLTREQKQIISKRGLNASEYMFLQYTDCGFEIIHKETSSKKTVNKY